ncbi:uncharacterized protein V1516DRAFT_670834 [Lipomyces oligophaga]|uniref:uncharacterized protein n=1 Tax=Lipomyces oligophaga TaxID=45792 RepID=UPI0034CE6336
MFSTTTTATTSSSPSCPSPLLPWQPLTAQHYYHRFEDSRVCIYGCCLPCLFRFTLYPEFQKLVLVLMILGYMSFSISVFFAVSHLLSRRFVMSDCTFMQATGLAIVISSIGFFNIRHEQNCCQDPITAAYGRVNPICMVQGILFTFGYHLAAGTMALRTVLLHISVVWSRTLPQKRIYYLSVLLYLAFTAGAAPFIAFIAGLMCAPETRISKYLLFIPLIVYAGIAIVAMGTTGIYVLHRLLHVEFSIYFAQTGTSRSPPMKTKFRLFMRCAKKYISIGWRTIIFTQYVTSIAMVQSFYFLTTSTSEITFMFSAGEFELVQCMMAEQIDHQTCIDKQRPLLGSTEILIVSIVMMCSSMFLFVTESKVLLFKGWWAMLKSPRAFISSQYRKQIVDELCNQQARENVFRRLHNQHADRRRKRKVNSLRLKLSMDDTSRVGESPGVSSECGSSEARLRHEPRKADSILSDEEDLELHQIFAKEQQEEMMREDQRYLIALDQTPKRNGELGNGIERNGKISEQNKEESSV